MRIAELLADREALAALEAEKAAAEAHKQRLMHELDSEARRVRSLCLRDSLPLVLADRRWMCMSCPQTRDDVSVLAYGRLRAKKLALCRRTDAPSVSNCEQQHALLP